MMGSLMITLGLDTQSHSSPGGDMFIFLSFFFFFSGEEYDAI